MSSTRIEQLIDDVRRLTVARPISSPASTSTTQHCSSSGRRVDCSPVQRRFGMRGTTRSQSSRPSSLSSAQSSFVSWNGERCNRMISRDHILVCIVRQPPLGSLLNLSLRISPTSGVTSGKDVLPGRPRGRRESGEDVRAGERTSCLRCWPLGAGPRVSLCIWGVSDSHESLHDLSGYTQLRSTSISSYLSARRESRPSQ